MGSTGCAFDDAVCVPRSACPAASDDQGPVPARCARARPSWSAKGSPARCAASGRTRRPRRGIGGSELRRHAARPELHGGGVLLVDFVIALTTLDADEHASGPSSHAAVQAILRDEPAQQ